MHIRPAEPLPQSNFQTRGRHFHCRDLFMLRAPCKCVPHASATVLLCLAEFGQQQLGVLSTAQHAGALDTTGPCSQERQQRWQCRTSCCRQRNHAAAVKATQAAYQADGVAAGPSKAPGRNMFCRHQEQRLLQRCVSLQLARMPDAGAAQTPLQPLLAACWTLVSCAVRGRGCSWLGEGQVA
jgi:hypothetical protein